MHDVPRQKLADLLAGHGTHVWQDPHRCEGLLRDLCSTHRREVFVLISALRDQVVVDLASAGPRTNSATIARLSQRLHDDYGIDFEAARWAVESWALALGLFAESELVAGSPDVPPFAVRQTLIVAIQGGGDFRSIRDALRTATKGTRIVVRPGYYCESLLVTQDVEIVGEGAREEIVVNTDREPCLRLKTLEAHVRGVSLCFRADRPDFACAAAEVRQGKLVLDDCDLTSNALSCALVQGATASIHLRRCCLHHSAECGLYVCNGGEAVADDCQMTHNTLSGVQAKQANVTLSNCRLSHQERNHGLKLIDNSQAIIEQCEFADNGLAGIAVAHGSRPTIRKSRIHSGRDVGIYFYEHGQGLVEDCEIAGNATSGIVIRQGSAPIVRRCRINQQRSHHGVAVDERASANFENCEIACNGGAGVVVRRDSKATLFKCDIHHHLKNNGVFVHERSQVRLEDCTIRDNGYAGVEIGDGGFAEILRNQIHQNNTVAVRASKRSRATVEGCDLRDNMIAAFNVSPDSVLTALDNLE